MKMKNRWKYLLKKYLSKELLIEYKACLYFCCVIFFYFFWLALQEIYLARVLYMCEMILTAYLIGYLQMYSFHNFDEAEHFGRKEIGQTVLCSSLYTAAAYLGSWFDKDTGATFLFFLFMLFTYFCVFIFHRLKRTVDTWNLNQMLTKYKEDDNCGGKENGN